VNRLHVEGNPVLLVGRSPGGPQVRRVLSNPQPTLHPSRTP
jgi:hypothetical protein